MATKTGEVDEDGLLFVFPPPDYLQLKCPICLDLLLDRSPHLVVCCGNHICASCIANLTHKPCPLCKAVLYNTVPDKGHQRALNCLKVYCTHQEKGCQWSGELKQLSKHVSRNGDCQYEVLSCKYECGYKEKRSLIIKHETNSCCLRPTVCQYCKVYKDTYEQVTKGHYTVCSFYPVFCSNGCGQSIKRNVLDNHVTKECVLRKVSCEFVEVGCKWTGTMNRLPQHLTDDWRHHIAFATLHNSKQMKEETKTLKQEIEDLKLQNETLHQRVSKLEGETADRPRPHPFNDKPHLSTGAFIPDSLKSLSPLKLSNDVLKSRSPGKAGAEPLIEQKLPALVLSSKGNYIFMKLPDEDPDETTSLIVDRWSHKRGCNNLHRTPLPYCKLFSKRGLQVTVHCNGIKSCQGSHVSVTANVLKIIDEKIPLYSFYNRPVGILETLKLQARQFRGNLLIILESPDPNTQSRYGVITFDESVDPKYCKKEGLEFGIEEFISFDEVVNDYLWPEGDSLHFKIQYFPLKKENDEPLL